MYKSTLVSLNRKASMQISSSKFPSNCTLLIHTLKHPDTKKATAPCSYTLKHPDTKKATALYSYTPSSIQTQTKQQHPTHTHPQASRHKQSNSTLLIHILKHPDTKKATAPYSYTLKHPDTKKATAPHSYTPSSIQTK
jgi:predicted MarR family transcription regulator